MRQLNAMRSLLLNNGSSQTSVSPKSRPSWLLLILSKAKTRFIFLQVLVSIILSYELLLSPHGLITFEAQQAVAVGLWLLAISMVMLPTRVFQAPWFPGTLLVGDTILTVSTIYLSGNASSHLYVAFFLLILIGASVRNLTQMLSLSLLVCAGYGFLLYQGVLVTGALSVGYLLGIPVLLVMAVFYGLMLESLAEERAQKVTLLERVNALKWEEAQLLKTRQELESQIGALKRRLGSVTREAHSGKIKQKGLETRLQQAHKMEAVGRLAGVIARDFGRLLRVIGGHTGQLLQKINRQDPLRPHVERILIAGDRASVLTGQLQQMSHQESFRPEVLHLNQTVLDLEPMLCGLLHDNMALQAELDPAVGFVRADRGQLELVIMNLVVNARDAMPRGGQLTIETRKAELHEVPQDHSESRHHEPFVVLAVSDTGCGMSVEIEARLFEPFVSTKEHATGTGLATVYGIVKQSGGYIEVESRRGQGTTCKVYLAAVQKTKQTPSTSDLAKYGPRGTETILLVEEDEVFRKLSLAALQRHEYHVLEARTPVEALLLAQKFAGPIHLMVSAAIMPDINGRELAERLVVQHPGLKVIYLGGYTDEVILNQRIHGTGFLQKPCTQKDLLEKVREVLDSRVHG